MWRAVIDVLGESSREIEGGVAAAGLSAEKEVGVGFREPTKRTHIRGLFFATFKVSAGRTDVRHVFGTKSGHCRTCQLECPSYHAPVDHVGGKVLNFEAMGPEPHQGRTQVVLQEVFGDVGGTHWFRPYGHSSDRRGWYDGRRALGSPQGNSCFSSGVGNDVRLPPCVEIVVVSMVVLMPRYVLKCPGERGFLQQEGDFLAHVITALVKGWGRPGIVSKSNRVQAVRTSSDASGCDGIGGGDPSTKLNLS